MQSDIRPRAVLILLLFSAVSTLAYASADATRPLQVAIKESPPFAIKDNGQWTGISPEIIERIATGLGREIVYHEYGTVPTMLRAVEANNVDLAISAITATAKREAFVDFSFPYFSTGPAVLVRSNESMLSIFMMIAGKVLGALLGLVILMYAVGKIVDWLDGDDEIKGVHEGAWWALVTFTTTGYGDLVPKTPRAKLLAAIWMVISLFLLSLFTGYVSSSMTVERLADTPTSLRDLHNSLVLTVTGSSSEEFLEQKEIEYLSVPNAQRAISMLQSKKADAFVYDKVLLDHIQPKGNYEVWPLGDANEFYSVVMPTDSPLKETVNLTILRKP